MLMLSTSARTAGKSRAHPPPPPLPSGHLRNAHTHISFSLPVIGTQPGSSGPKKPPRRFPKTSSRKQGEKTLLCDSSQDPQAFCAPVSSQLPESGGPTEVHGGFISFLTNIYLHTVLERVVSKALPVGSFWPFVPVSLSVKCRL